MRLVRASARVGRGDMMRRSGITLMSALLALLAAGCQVPWASSGQAAGSQQITVAVVPNFANAPLQVAAKDGLFTENRVNVTVRTYQTLQQAYAHSGYFGVPGAVGLRRSRSGSSRRLDRPTHAPG